MGCPNTKPEDKIIEAVGKHPIEAENSIIKQNHSPTGSRVSFTPLKAETLFN